VEPKGRAQGISPMYEEGRLYVGDGYVGGTAALGDGCVRGGLHLPTLPASHVLSPLVTAIICSTNFGLFKRIL
jgi:hypothetical protein